MDDLRRHAPAAQRNRAPIADVLRDVLPGLGLVLEIASGGGEHVVHFAEAFRALEWQPSDPDRAARASIAAWTAGAGLANIRAPLALDAVAREWPIDRADAIVCINMVHISPWSATLGLLAGAGRLLAPGALLYLYGPYRRAGVPIAPSNEAFDQSLKARDPEWGLRDLEAVTREASARGLDFVRLVEMPANNISVIYRRV